MNNTIANYGLMRKVMADLRENGAKCCILHTRQVDGSWDTSIRAFLKDGRLWDIARIEEVSE